ncbi:alpha/beta fold hydrolase [Ammoniphilus resinae]|uniref:Pimeloyl-ACP methyl ester carboxylesterase n=1 Tax=Ammoniphilus resinae TaxID=861532 RepID=A0ABS4GSU2_9BACL|nr:alpha/beta hydrolase [Ammoniphilus resinae]MBP1933343.1 pimeloyl-ACP methyl ester carboxylesterase [Ammoniphilus resinae]
MKHDYVEIPDGYRLHYVREGQGIPVLLLHGWPGFWYDWCKVIPLLSKEADVIVPDFRGFGLSDKPKIEPVAGYSPAILARDIIGILDHLGVDEVIVAAHDIGATIAQTLAKTYPSRIKSLVLFNPPYPGIGARRFDPDVQPQFWYQHLHNLDLFEQLFANEPSAARKYVRHFYEHWSGEKGSIEENDLQSILDRYAEPGALLSSIMYYRARAADKAKQASGSSPSSPIIQETSVVWGEADPVMKVEWSDRLGEFFENFTLKRLSGIGHFVPLESPKEAAAAILSHLPKN